MAIKEQTRRHLMDRIASIESRLIKESKQHATDETREGLSKGEKLSLIANGKAKFNVEVVKAAMIPKRRDDYLSAPQLTDCFIYPDEEKTRAHNEKVSAKSTAQIIKIRQHAQRLRDDVMLKGLTLSAEQLTAFEEIKL